MAVCYKKLWKLMIDKELKKKFLVETVGLSQATIKHLNHNENVNTETLVKICKALDCRVEDVMEIVPDKEEN